MKLLFIKDELVSCSFKEMMVEIILLWYLDFTGYIQKSNVTTLLNVNIYNMPGEKIDDDLKMCKSILSSLNYYESFIRVV